MTDIDYANITSIIWHPRNKSQMIIGSKNGTVLLLDYDKNKELIVYDRIKEFDNTNANRLGIIDIIFSPGEDVFLAL